MKRVLVLAFLAVVLVAGLMGCGGDSGETVLAEVGPRTITAENLIEALSGMKPEDRPDLSTVEAKQAFVDDLVNRELMELAAFEKYPQLTEPQTWRLKRFRDSQLTSLVRNHTIRQQVVVTDAMKDELYELMKRELHLQGMLLMDEGTAEWARKQLDEGADFAAITKERSVQWNLNDPPGDLGWKKAGEFHPDMEREIWSAPVGATVGPRRAAMGWYIFRVLDERPSEPEGTREDLDSFLEGELLEPIYMFRQRLVMDSLRATAGPTYPSQGMSLIMAKYYWEPTEEEAENPFARLDANRQSPELTPEEEAVIVIDFETLPDWSAKEFISRLEWYPTGLWPTGSSEAQLEELLDIMVRDDLWLRAGADLGLVEDPEFQEILARREREMKVTYFYYTDIMAGHEVGPEQIVDWYEENKERYKAPPSVKLAFFVSKDAALVEELAADWRNGDSFMSLRDKYEARDPEMEAVGESPWAYMGQDPVFDDLIAPLDEGAISEVLTRADMSSVYRVVAKRDTMIVAYEEIKQQVDKDAKTSLGDQYFQEFLEGQKANFPVTVNASAVEKLKIPEFEDPATEE